jgi:hypothetical protein
MQSSVLAVVIVAAGAGCGAGGGTLAGSAGAGGSAPILGSAGAGPSLTGAAGINGMSCAGIPRRASLLPPDVVIVLDASVSMNDAVDGSCTGGCGELSRWSAAVRAIDAVVTATTAKVNWGLTALPDFGDACDGGRIAVPAGPYDAGRINQEIARRTNGGVLLNPGNSPLRASVHVAAAYLLARAPGGHRIVLVITDGEPDCAPGVSDPFASDAAGTVQAVTDAASLGITTSVIGIATAGGPAEATLTAMARAGDVTAATYIPAANGDELAAAMTARVADAANCTIAIPDPPTNDGTTSRSDIGLGWEDPASRIQLDPSHTNGWDYTDESRLGAQLYGPACDGLRSGNGVYVVFLCHGA